MYFQRPLGLLSSVGEVVQTKKCAPTWHRECVYTHVHVHVHVCVCVRVCAHVRVHTCEVRDKLHFHDNTISLLSPKRIYAPKSFFKSHVGLRFHVLNTQVTWRYEERLIRVINKDC